MKKHPELVDSVTVVIVDSVKLDPIKTDTNIQITVDHSGLDSALIDFRGMLSSQLDSVGMIQFKSTIERYYNTTTILQDTATWLIDSGRMIIKVFQVGDQLQLEFERTGRYIVTETDFTYKRIVEDRLSFLERAWVDVTKWGFWIFWIVVVIIILGIARKFLKPIFPIIP